MIKVSVTQQHRLALQWKSTMASFIEKEDLAIKLANKLMQTVLGDSDITPPHDWGSLTNS